MIRLRDIPLPPEHNAHQLQFEAAQMLHISVSKIRQVKIVRRSVDARKKPDIKIIYTVDVAVDGNEEKIMDGAGWLEVDLTGVKVVDPKNCDKLDEYVKDKKVTEEFAKFYYNIFTNNIIYIFGRFQPNVRVVNGKFTHNLIDIFYHLFGIFVRRDARFFGFSDNFIVNVRIISCIRYVVAFLFKILLSWCPLAPYR